MYICSLIHIQNFIRLDLARKSFVPVWLERKRWPITFTIITNNSMRVSKRCGLLLAILLEANVQIVLWLWLEGCFPWSLASSFSRWSTHLNCSFPWRDCTILAVERLKIKYFPTKNIFCHGVFWPIAILHFPVILTRCNATKRFRQFILVIYAIHVPQTCKALSKMSYWRWRWFFVAAGEVPHCQSGGFEVQHL